MIGLAANTAARVVAAREKDNFMLEDARRSAVWIVENGRKRMGFREAEKV